MNHLNRLLLIVTALHKFWHYPADSENLNVHLKYYLINGWFIGPTADLSRQF